MRNDAGLSYNATTNVLTTTATAAKYADLAENYLADQEYSVGTVLRVGGSAEVTQTTILNSPSIAGVVSEKPSYLMNAGLEGANVLSIALKGRVPCKVVGKVKKGDVLISSHIPGHATACDQPHFTGGTAVVGIALEDHISENTGIIEILI